jgi:chromosomal replication initiation ATPase DnaA
MLCDRINPLPAAYCADPKAYILATRLRIDATPSVLDVGMLSTAEYHRGKIERGRVAVREAERQRVKAQLYRRRTFLAAAVQIAANAFCTSVTEVMDGAKTLKAATARHTIMHIAHHQKKTTLWQVAKFFDQTTTSVVNASTKISNLLKSNPEFAETYAQIVAKIEAA